MIDLANAILISFGPRVLVCTEEEARTITAFTNHFGEDATGIINWATRYTDGLEVPAKTIIDALFAAYELQRGNPLREDSPRRYWYVGEDSTLVLTDKPKQYEWLVNLSQTLTPEGKTAVRAKTALLGSVMEFSDIKTIIQQELASDVPVAA